MLNNSLPTSKKSSNIWTQFMTEPSFLVWTNSLSQSLLGLRGDLQPVMCLLSASPSFHLAPLSS